MRDKQKRTSRIIHSHVHFCHARAGGGAFATGSRAAVHVLILELIAILGTGLADSRANRADFSMVGGSPEHEIGARPADVGTVQYPAKMVWRRMFATHGQTMLHGGFQAGPITIETVCDALIQCVIGGMRHGMGLFGVVRNQHLHEHKVACAGCVIYRAKNVPYEQRDW